MNLESIFQGRILRIPDYQRGYAWEKEQLQDFWDDLQCLKEGNFHYIGFLTLQKVQPKNSENDYIKKIQLVDDDNKITNYFHIVDGQQRLTTSLILLKVMSEEMKEFDAKLSNEIIKKFISTDGSYPNVIFGYEKDDPSFEFLKNSIFQIKTNSYQQGEKSLYTNNLLEAKKFFSKKIDGMNLETLKKNYKKITEEFMYNLYELDDTGVDVHVMFETMNNRGKPLSNLEILKNRLIYLSSFFDEGSNLRNEIKNVWKKVYSNLGRKEEPYSSEDDFLKNHWIMYPEFKFSKKKGDDYIKDLLNEHFSQKKVNNKLLEKIKNYIDSLGKSSEHWYDLHNPNSEDIFLKKLSMLGFYNFKPLIMAIMYKDENTADICETMERYVFLVHHIGREASSYKETEIYNLSKSLIRDEKTISECNDLIFKLIQPEEHMKKFKNKIDDLFSKRSGYYSWSGINYFLYEYDLSLRSSDNDDRDISWNNYIKPNHSKKTIEHILPQNPKEGSNWIQTFGKYLDSDVNCSVCNSLGNLVPLSSERNSKYSNHDFNYKTREIKDKFGKNISYENGSRSQLEVSKKPKWSLEEIRERGINLLKFMETRWRIKISHDDKNELLHLGFEES